MHFKQDGQPLNQHKTCHFPWDPLFFQLMLFLFQPYKLPEEDKIDLDGLISKTDTIHLGLI